EYVRLLEQFFQDGFCLGILYIQRQAFLGSVHPDEMRGLSLYRGVVAARRVAASRALDLDDARAQFGELTRAERPGDDLLEADHGNSLERALHVNLISRLRVAKPCRSVRQVSPGATGCASVMVPVLMISPAASCSPCFCSSSTRYPRASNGLPSTL